MSGGALVAGKHIKILTGHYGSGKTEIALNMALSIKNAGYETTLIDLDIVNPFFRSAERAGWLAQNGIALYMPNYALSAVDVMSLPAEITSVFARPGLRAVFDVGGDDAGAAALGRYREHFEAAVYDLYVVINVYRPRSSSAKDILSLIDRIASRARLTPTGLINNANLGMKTTHRELEYGFAALQEVSDRSGIPIMACCGMPEVTGAFDGHGSVVYTIERHMTPEWM
jgi:hypothetical protein